MHTHKGNFKTKLYTRLRMFCEAGYTKAENYTEQLQKKRLKKITLRLKNLNAGNRNIADVTRQSNLDN